MGTAVTGLLRTSARKDGILCHHKEQSWQNNPYPPTSLRGPQGRGNPAAIVAKALDCFVSYASSQRRDTLSSRGAARRGDPGMTLVRTWRGFTNAPYGCDSAGLLHAYGVRKDNFSSVITRSNSDVVIQSCSLLL
jgi:hypothetical protein